MINYGDFTDSGKGTKSKPGFVRKNVWMKIETWDKFRQACQDEGLSPSELIEELVEDYLADREDQPLKD